MSKSSANGRREGVSEQREHCVRPSNFPTQANTGLEWATRLLAIHTHAPVTQLTPIISNTPVCRLTATLG
jgi:hypothetical protein